MTFRLWRVFENEKTLGCVENNLEVWHTVESGIFLSLWPSSPIAIVPSPPPCQVSRAEPNYPLTNRVQSLVIAFAITIIISITISATYSPLSCQVCLKHLRKVKLDLQNRFGNRNGTFLVHLVRNPIVQHCSFS